MLEWLGEVAHVLLTWAVMYALIWAGVLLAFAPRDLGLTYRWQEYRARHRRRSSG